LFADKLSSSAASNGVDKSKTASSLSCETLSVFDGVTVRVEYIVDDDISNGNLKDNNLTSSKDLLIELEERKRAAAQVTTVPLRQALSANYKSTTIPTAVLNGRTESFTTTNSKFYDHIEYRYTKNNSMKIVKKPGSKIVVLELTSHYLTGKMRSTWDQVELSALGYNQLVSCDQVDISGRVY
jgi:hypothetical protein